MNVIDGVSGIVLAGGQSRRMGKDKCQLKVHGQTFLQRAEKLLKDTGIDNMSVLGPHKGGIGDTLPYAGPAQAIVQYVTSPQLLTSRLVVVVAVDMPRITPRELLPLVECGKTHQRACCYQGEYLPAVIPVDEKDRLRYQVLAEGNTSMSMRALLAEAKVHFLPLDKNLKRQLLNINSAQDWQGYVDSLAKG
jgi:molybdopterin-guanine dinucleotide biosynthesis protein A